LRQSLKLGLPTLAVLIAGVAFFLAGQGNTLGGIAAGIAAMACLSLGAMAADALVGALVTSALGFGVSIYLTLQHQVALAGGASVCNINETFNCDLINTSEYSELFGIPIALMGAGFYTGIGLIAYLGWRRREKYEQAAGVVVAAGVGAVLYSAFLAWASTTLGAWCLFCISLYVLNTLLLVSGVLAFKANKEGSIVAGLMGAGGDRSMITAVAVGVAALTLGVMVYRSQETSAIPETSGGEAPDEQLALLYEQPGGEIALGGHETAFGAADAPYTLLEYADFECPHCGRTAKELKKIAMANPDLKIVFRHYPLSPKCNENVGRDMHPYACDAAAASVCADRQGQMWDMIDMMFSNQQYLSPDDLEFMGGQLGLDMDAFKACMAEDEPREVVARDIAAGQKANIFSTPSLFLNGVHPDGWIKISMGPDAIPFLLEAAREGRTLPPARPPKAQ